MTNQAGTPAFFFQIDRMEENRDIPVRTNIQGLWMPPRRRYGSQIRRGTTGKLYYFNGNRASEIDELPDEATFYKATSMYHDHDLFWMVPYDATEYQVGNGLQSEFEPDSDEDAEGDSDDEPNPLAVDWCILYFMWRNSDWASHCAFGANRQRLCGQRPDQRWVNELLPMRNQADLERRTTDTRYGGLYGDLGILLGLLALSVRVSDVDAAVRHAVRSVLGDDGGWRSYGRPHQPRTDRRGVLVKIWSYPPFSTATTLEQLEVGNYGKIYR